MLAVLLFSSRYLIHANAPTAPHSCCCGGSDLCLLVMVRVTSQSTAPHAHLTAPHEASQEHFDDQGRQTYAHCMPVGVQEDDWWVQQREWGTGGNEGGERGKAVSRGNVDSPLRIGPAATTVIGFKPKQRMQRWWWQCLLCRERRRLRHLHLGGSQSEGSIACTMPTLDRKKQPPQHTAPRGCIHFC